MSLPLVSLNKTEMEKCTAFSFANAYTAKMLSKPRG